VSPEVIIMTLIVVALVGLAISLLFPPKERLPEDDEDRFYGGGW
jgi:hypothetical protein